MSELQPALKFRDFIQVLKDEDDLVEITEEVDSNLEVGAIMRKAYDLTCQPHYSETLKVLRRIFSAF